MEYQYHYDGLVERQQKIAEAEGQGYQMLHDDFAPDWIPGTEPHGTLTFTDEIPQPPEPTPDQLLAAQISLECNSYHTLGLQAYRNYASLTLAQKDQILKFLLGYYLSSGERLGYFAI